jgi:spore coat polysaccharide biosynthesis protein SpsF
MGRGLAVSQEASTPAFARDVALIVQVRLGSTRLPGKALLPLGGATMTDMVLARLALVPTFVHVLATDEASAAALGPIASRHGFELLVGDPEDVLARYCLAIRRFHPRCVVRATGDNPLVAHEPAIRLLELADEEIRAGARPADYLAFSGLPLGMGVELVSAAALLRAEGQARAPAEREHVCPYLYGHPELFEVRRPPAPEAWSLPEGRVTVDTAEDYEAMLRLYGALYDGDPIPTAAVLRYIRDRARTGVTAPAGCPP